MNNYQEVKQLPVCGQNVVEVKKPFKAVLTGLMSTSLEVWQQLFQQEYAPVWGRA